MFICLQVATLTKALRTLGDVATSTTCLGTSLEISRGWLGCIAECSYGRGDLSLHFLAFVAGQELRFQV
jgi:hypothetical protein